MRFDVHTHHYPAAYFELIERAGGDFSFATDPSGQRIIRYRGSRFFGVTPPMTDPALRLRDMDGARVDVAILGDETPASAIAALEGVVAAFARAGVVVRRVLTDNGNCYRSADFAAACRQLGIRHLRTRPYTPRTNGKAERFIKTMLSDWAYARLYRSSDERTAALSAFLDDYRSRPNVGLNGHAPLCRFAVNDLSGNHT